MVLTVEQLALILGGSEREIFRDISFTLGEGESALLTGPSGSGKTALGIALCGQLPSWTGTFGLRGGITLLGEPVTQGRWNPDAGIILENPYTQLSGLKNTVIQELAFPLECRGTPRTEIPPVIDRYARIFEIAHLLERKVHTLSGGELQRVLASCALISGPRFIFLDRPLTEIDFDFRPVFLDITRSHARSAGGAALMAEDPWLIPDAPFDRMFRIDPEKKTLLTTKNTENTEGKTEEKNELGEYRRRNAPSGDLLRVENLEFSYPAAGKILNGLSFSIGRGEIAFITGPNGAGKTTLARLLAGILRPNAGEMVIDGRRCREMKQREIMAMTGLALQNAALHLSRVSVREELDLASRWGYPPGALTEILGLGRILDAHPLDITQAEKKRLAMALSAGGNRRTVILDEPTQYQDQEGFRRMADAVRRIAHEGKAVLLISHDPRLYEEFPEAGNIPLKQRNQEERTE